MGQSDRRCGIWFDKRARWQPELRALRDVLLDCGLDEAFKWRGPVYCAHGGNIAVVWGFKDHCAVGFFKGVLLEDSERRLVAPGPNSRSVRMMTFAYTNAIQAQEPDLRAHIAQAIENERAGRKVDFPKDDLAMPDELATALDADPDLRAAFEALTPGRQRGYILQISGAKQSRTRAARVEKWTPRILDGLGMHDR